MTITLDDDTARWARIRAAEANTSVSRLVGDLLRRTMQEENVFDRARREFGRIGTAVISSGEYPRREELHDRSDLR